jgi:hypothetical protein
MHEPVLMQEKSNQPAMSYIAMADVINIHDISGKHGKPFEPIVGRQFTVPMSRTVNLL